MSTRNLRTTTSAMVLSLALAGCGGDGADDRATTITPKTDGAASSAAAAPEGDGDKTLTAAQVKSALLTVQDLPTGYSVDTSPEEESEDDITNSDDADCVAKFKGLNDADNEDQSEQAKASFTGPGLGTVLEQGIESFDDEEVPEKRLKDVVEVLSDCPTFSSTEDGVKSDFSVSSLSFPKLGDDTVSLALTVKTPEVSVGLNIVLVRLGRNVMSVTQGGLATDVVALEQASRKGLDRLAAATR